MVQLLLANMSASSFSTAFSCFFPRQVVRVSSLPRNICSTFISPPFRAVLSAPFPLPDPFAFPAVNFSTSFVSSDIRPELLGASLWTAGLYLGFSQHRRWGSSVQYLLKDAMSNLLPDEIADLIAAFLHSLPFLIAGFGIDALLRYATGSNAVWAVASGVSVAMYGGIYELARQSARVKQVSGEDKDFRAFGEFAERRLVGTGRCHLIDIREAARQDPQGRRLGYISDETLRRFIRNTFPRAIRSPNGYYRGLSVRDDSTTHKDAKRISSSSSPK